jgi:hypothetical protein
MIQLKKNSLILSQSANLANRNSRLQTTIFSATLHFNFWAIVRKILEIIDKTIKTCKEIVCALLNGHFTILESMFFLTFVNMSLKYLGV